MGILIDWLEAFGGGEDTGGAVVVGLGAVVGGRGTMAGRSFGFDESLRPCPSPLFSPSMTALGILDHHARRSNMVYQYLVPLRLALSTMDYDFCFPRARNFGASHRSLDVGS